MHRLPGGQLLLVPTFNTSVLRAAGRRPQPVSRQPIPFALSHLFAPFLVPSVMSQVDTIAKTESSAVSVLS